jgi:hypothetical protein
LCKNPAAPIPAAAGAPREGFARERPARSLLLSNRASTGAPAFTRTCSGGPRVNFVQLILTVCTLAEPSVCDERKMLFESSGPLRACFVQAQPFIAQWVGEHPTLRVAAWRCTPPGAEGDKI